MVSKALNIKRGEYHSVHHSSSPSLCNSVHMSKMIHQDFAYQYVMWTEEFVVSGLRRLSTFVYLIHNNNNNNRPNRTVAFAVLFVEWINNIIRHNNAVEYLCVVTWNKRSTEFIRNDLRVAFQINSLFNSTCVRWFFCIHYRMSAPRMTCRSFSKLCCGRRQFALAYFVCCFVWDSKTVSWHLIE